MKAKYTLRYILIPALLFFALSGLHATKWVVQVSNFVFTPSSLANVLVGDTVRWEWVIGTHTTTSSTIPSGAPTWDEPITSTNQVFEYKVTIAGTYNYVCTPHASIGMIGSFVASAPTPTLTVMPSNQDVRVSPRGTSRDPRPCGRHQR